MEARSQEGQAVKHGEQSIRRPRCPLTTWAFYCRSQATPRRIARCGETRNGGWQPECLATTAWFGCNDVDLISGRWTTTEHAVWSAERRRCVPGAFVIFTSKYRASHDDTPEGSDGDDATKKYVKSGKPLKYLINDIDHRCKSRPTGDGRRSEGANAGPVSTTCTLYEVCKGKMGRA